MADLACVTCESSQKSSLSCLYKPPEHRSLPVKQGIKAIKIRNVTHHLDGVFHTITLSTSACDISLPRTAPPISWSWAQDVYTAINNKQLFSSKSILSSCTGWKVHYFNRKLKRNASDNFSCALKYEHTSLDSFLMASALEEAEGIKPGSDRGAPSCAAEVLTLL